MEALVSKVDPQEGQRTYENGRCIRASHSWIVKIFWAYCAPGYVIAITLTRARACDDTQQVNGRPADAKRNWVAMGEKLSCGMEPPHWREDAVRKSGT
jgi:hypothetical protein